MIPIAIAFKPIEPAPSIMLPFAALPLGIALAPLILKDHWERFCHRVCEIASVRRNRL